VSGFAYILRCSDGSYYVGSTTNLESRFDAPRLGLAGEYTSKRLPVRLVWAEEFETISEAFAIEHQIKGWRRAKKEALIAGRFELLPELAKTARPMLKKGRRPAFDKLRQQVRSPLPEKNRFGRPTLREPVLCFAPHALH